MKKKVTLLVMMMSAYILKKAEKCALGMLPYHPKV